MGCNVLGARKLIAGAEGKSVSAQGTLDHLAAELKSVPLPIPQPLISLSLSCFGGMAESAHIS